MTNKELFNFVKNKRGSISRDNCNRIIDRSIQTIEIPSVSSIGAYAFRSCSSLTNVTIPNSVTSIEAWAFCDCSSLTSIEIPNSTTNIGVGAFYGCRNLTNVMIPNNVTSIENYTFYQCWNLTNVTIPNSVTDVESDAFLNCINLENVTFEEDFQCSGLNLSASTKFSVDTMIAMFNALADRTGLSAYTLTLGNTNLAKLNNEQIAIATEKNWTLA